MGRSRGSSFVFAAAYLAVVVGLFLALGGAAYAQSSPTSAGDQYGPKVAGVQVSATTETQTAGAAESLPNTGLSLLGVAVVGGALVATGVALRRRERRKS
jgi:LPXTG-motif cell wall-anchored protein